MIQKVHLSQDHICLQPLLNLLKPPVKCQKFHNHRFQLSAEQYAQQILNASVLLAHERINFPPEPDISVDPSHAPEVERQPGQR